MMDLPAIVTMKKLRSSDFLPKMPSALQK